MNAPWLLNNSIAQILIVLFEKYSDFNHFSSKYSPLIFTRRSARVFHASKQRCGLENRTSLHINVFLAFDKKLQINFRYYPPTCIWFLKEEKITSCWIRNVLNREYLSFGIRLSVKNSLIEMWANARFQQSNLVTFIWSSPIRIQRRIHGCSRNYLRNIRRNLLWICYVCYVKYFEILLAF